MERAGIGGISAELTHTDKFYIPDFILNPVGQTLRGARERERVPLPRYHVQDLSACSSLQTAVSYLCRCK